MIMKKLCMIASAAILAAGSVQASGPGAAPSEPIVYHQPVSGFSWGGMYAGASLGYGSSNYAGTFTSTFLFPIEARFDLGGQGMVGAVQLGYNFMASDRVVVGVQADATFSRIETPLDILPFLEYTLGARTIYTVAGRAGYLTTPDTMVYGLLGASRGNFRGSSTLGSYDFTQNGLAIGMGIETRLTDRMTLGLEYRYNRFGRINVIDAGPAAQLNFNTSVQTIRASLNYHF
jgi:outer membrane immunogenic protein